MEVMLYTNSLSSRLTYIADYIFGNLLVAKIKYTSKIEDFRAFNGPKINYSNEKIDDNYLHIYPAHLLFEQGVKLQTITTKNIKNNPIIFPNSTFDATVTDGSSLGFDPLAASFYILTRYEEYLPYTPDQHGRYSAKLSWAYQNQCLDRPIIWEWANLLKTALQGHFPAWNPSSPGYQFLPTYDIDIPWAFRYRSWRAWARMVLDLFQGNWSLIRARLATLSGKDSDPFFVFNELENLHQSSGLRPAIFWLLGDSNRYDINPSYRVPALRQLIKLTSKWAAVGIHPSYASFGQTEQIIKERARLDDITNSSIILSRQHFLRLRLPVTYRQLIEAGIRHDYTMGYADETGYRAGTTEAFLWYDLERDETTELWVHPFAVMDVTLKNYLQLSPQQARKKLIEMQTYCQNQQLSFSTLWHNSSFSDLHGWSGWWEVYSGLFNQNQQQEP